MWSCLYEADLALDGLGLIIDGDDAGPPGLDRHHQRVLSAAPHSILRLAAHQRGPGVVWVVVLVTSDHPRGPAPVGDQGSSRGLERRAGAQDGGAPIQVLEADFGNPEKKFSFNLIKNRRNKVYMSLY